jgi:hypothetical protein
MDAISRRSKRAMFDDDHNNGRDQRGRWKKGHCPNLRGRPRKAPDISDSDVGWFKQRLVKATINGEERWLTRHELLLHSMFEQAIKGKSVNLARKLFDRFENVDDTWAQAQDWLHEKREAFLTAHQNTGKFDHALANEILELEKMLTYGHVPKPSRKPRIKRDPGPPTWRKGPKPQAILDLEKEWAAAGRHLAAGAASADLRRCAGRRRLRRPARGHHGRRNLHRPAATSKPRNSMQLCWRSTEGRNQTIA